MLDAIYFALFAEKLGPEIVQARQVMDVDMAGMSPEQKLTVAAGKMEAPARYEALRSLLGLTDG